MKDTFQAIGFDEITHDEDIHNFSVINQNHSVGDSFNLVNYIPKSVIRLEELYDLHDKFKRVVNCETKSSCMKYEINNLWIENNPQNINLGVDCTIEERSPFINLFNEYKYVFAWTYYELKTFDTNVMQHIIPMKPEDKPSQHKLRKMYPNLEPSIKKELNKLLAAKVIFPACHTH